MKIINSTLLSVKVFQDGKQISPSLRNDVNAEYNIDETKKVDIKVGCFKYSLNVRNSEVLSISVGKSSQKFLFFFFVYTLITYILEKNNLLSDTCSLILLIGGCLLLICYIILLCTKKLYKIESIN